MKWIFITFIALLMITIPEIANAQQKPQFSLIHDDGFDSVTALAYSSDGSKFISGTVNIIIWDTQTGEKLQVIPEVAPECVSLSHDGSMIAIGRSHLLTKILDVKTGNLLFSHEGPFDPSGPLSILAINFTQKEDKVLFVDQNGYLNIWDYQNDIIDSMHIPSFGINWPPIPIQLFKDGVKILYGSHVLSLLEKKELFRFSGTPIIINDLQIASLIRSGGSYQFCHKELYDINTYEEIDEYPHFNCKSIQVKLSPDGNHVLIGKTKDNNEETRIVDTQTTQVQKTFQNSKGTIDNIDRILFSPNGEQVALVSGNVINLYDLSDLTSTVENAESMDR